MLSRRWTDKLTSTVVTGAQAAHLRREVEVSTAFFPYLFAGNIRAIPVTRGRNQMYCLRTECVNPSRLKQGNLFTATLKFRPIISTKLVTSKTGKYARHFTHNGNPFL